MNCHRVDCPDCCHISHQDNCDIRKAKITNPGLDGCLHYETPGEHDLQVAFRKILDDIDQQFKDFDDINQQFKDFDEWRDRCILGGVRAGIVILIAYAAWVVWMLT